MNLNKCPEWLHLHWVFAHVLHTLTHARKSRCRAIMARIYATSGLALLIAASSLMPARAAVVPLNHIVAIVNDEVITRQELAKRYDEVVQNLSRQKTPLPPRTVLEKQLLERMITELALQQHARSTGIRVDPAQVERALQRIAAQNKLDMAGLQAALEKDGQSLDGMRNTIRNEILIART